MSETNETAAPEPVAPEPTSPAPTPEPVAAAPVLPLPVAGDPWPRLKVEGGPDEGWIVDIHDGTVWGVYHPTAATADDALREAWAEHQKRAGKIEAEIKAEASANG